MNSTGKPIIGYIGTNVPEEIIYAGNIEPYRMTILKMNSEAHQQYVPSDYCCFSKNLIDAAVENRYDFLDGIIFTNSCTTIQKVYDIWASYFKTPFVYMLEVPKIRTQSAFSFFEHQLIFFKEAIENHFSIEISNENIINAISYTNKLRKNRNQLSTDKYSDKIYAQPVASTQSPPRILLIRGIVGYENIGDEITSIGGDLVIEYDLAMENFQEGFVQEKVSPIKALTNFYLDRYHVNHIDMTNSEFKKILNIITCYKIDGVVFILNVDCVPGIYKYSYLKRHLMDNRIPAIVVNTTAHSQNDVLLNRLESFIESLKN